MDTFPQPHNSKILVRLPEEKERTTASGIILTPSAVDNEPTKAEVLAVGPGFLLQDGSRSPMPFKIGTYVLFNRYNGQPITLNDEKCLFLDESEILATFP